MDLIFTRKGLLSKHTVHEKYVSVEQAIRELCSYKLPAIQAFAVT